jgi:hypothetical protein
MLDRMALTDMAALGRRGGLAGGPARAAALSGKERSAVARKAALARWAFHPLVLKQPTNHDELLAFVAYHGAKDSHTSPACDLENVVLQALASSHRDPALCRMLPVFLFRVCNTLDAQKVAALVRPDLRDRLGFFLELGGKLGRTKVWNALLSKLAHGVKDKTPELFFPQANSQVDRLLAEERTPEVARKWGFLMNMDEENFRSHFEKMVRL